MKNASQSVSGVLYRHAHGVGRCLPFIYASCRQKTLSCYPPMQSHDMHTYLDGQPSGTGLHALSPSATHTATIADRSRELLPHVLTLTLFIYIRRLFSSALRHPCRSFPLGSRVSCSAPTFLLPSLRNTSGRPNDSHFLCFLASAKVIKKD